MNNVKLYFISMMVLAVTFYVISSLIKKKNPVLSGSMLACSIVYFIIGVVRVTVDYVVNQSW